MALIQKSETGIPYNIPNAAQTFSGSTIGPSGNTHLIQNAQSYHNGVIHTVLDADCNVLSMKWLPDISVAIGPTPSLCYGNGVLYMGAASTYQVTGYVSSDSGATWTYAPMPAHYSKSPTKFLNGKFTYLAAQEWTGAAYDFVTSTNGVNWTVVSGALTSAGTSITDLAYGNGLYVALTWDNTYFTSPDGVVWTQRNFPAGYYPSYIAYSSGAGKFSVVGYDNQAAASSDGINWTTATVPGTNPNLTSIIATDVGFAASQHINASPQNRCWTSTNGVNWTERTFSGSSSSAASVWWTGTKLIAANIGNGISYISSNYGSSWSNTIIPYWAHSFSYSPHVINSDTLYLQSYAFGPYGVFTPSSGAFDLLDWDASMDFCFGERAYSQGYFVTLFHGASWTYGGTVSQIKRSTDGVNWSTVSLPSSKVYGGITYSADMIVIYNFNANFLAVSTDGGATWTDRTFPANVGRCSVVGTTIFAAAYGTTTTIYVSSNYGASFSSTTAPASLNGWCYRAGAYKNLIIATCSGQTTYAYSTNGGATWSAGTFPASGMGDSYFNPAISVFSKDDKLYTKTSSSGVVYSTSDGINWTLEADITAVPNGGFIAGVGENLVSYTPGNGERLRVYYVPTPTWFTNFVGCTEIP